MTSLSLRSSAPVRKRGGAGKLARRRLRPAKPGKSGSASLEQCSIARAPRGRRRLEAFDMRRMNPGYLFVIGVVAALGATGLAAQTGPDNGAPDGATPLHQAVKQNDLKGVDALL